jgi:hypothetical protein
LLWRSRKDAGTLDDNGRWKPMHAVYYGAMEYQYVPSQSLPQLWEVCKRCNFETLNNMPDFTKFTRHQLERWLYFAEHGLDLYTRKPWICKSKAEHEGMIAKFKGEIETINSLLSATNTN